MTKAEIVKALRATESRSKRELLDAAADLIEELVPVVRCKDCIHCGFCGKATNLEVMGFYGFCSRGERRKETEVRDD